MSPPGVNIISEFLGAKVIGGSRLKEGGAFCKGTELNHIKFQNWLWSF